MDSISPELIWLIVGLVFLFLEFLIPGVVLVFFGLGAFITAALVWAGVLGSMTGQLLFFSAASLVLLFSLRRFVSRAFRGKVKANADYDDQGTAGRRPWSAERSDRVRSTVVSNSTEPSGRPLPPLRSPREPRSRSWAKRTSPLQ